MQVLAIPVAISALGAERYGVFLTISAALSWIAMTNLGIGPGLTHGIARAAAAGTVQDERRYFVTACSGTALFATIALGALAALLWVFPVESLLGQQYAPYRLEIGQGVVVLALILAFQILISPVEAARAGYQEQFVTNAWNGGAGILSLLLLFAAAAWWPTITAMIVAVYGSAALVKGPNMYQMVRARRYLLPAAGGFDRTILRVLLSTGLAFSMVQFSSLLAQQASVFLVGRLLGPVQAAEFGVVFRLVFFAGGIVIMFTQPLWPAYADAASRGDKAWISSAYRKSLLLIAYAAAGGLVLGLFGRPIVQFWVGKDVMPSASLCAWMGAYLFTSACSHVHYMTLLGLGHSWRPAWLTLTEALLGTVLAVLLLPQVGATGAAAALVVANALVSLWAFPLLTWRSIDRLAGPGAKSAADCPAVA